MAAPPQKVQLSPEKIAENEWIASFQRHLATKPYLYRELENTVPIEYNPRRHGIYCPWRDYRAEPPKVSCWDMKMKELPGRLKNNFDMKTFYRRVHQWRRKYLHVKNPGYTPFLQLFLVFGSISYMTGGKREHDKVTRPVLHMSSFSRVKERTD